jgi:inosose dehydratase
MAKKLKIAGAPISWGVCEAPNWGHQMGPARVLREMADLGLGATEFGPLGFLPVDPENRARVLKEHGMEAIGGFFPIVLHKADHDPMPEVLQELKSYKAAGAYKMVLAANTGIEGYDEKRPELDEAGWQIMFDNLNKIRAACEAQGVDAVLHPHVGTMVETEADIMKVLHGSTIMFCLDTGHMYIGGCDPVEFSAKHADRVGHVHMKDTNDAVARQVRNGEKTYYEGMINGLYAPLGQGDIDMKAIVKNLVNAGYDGWFVLEQDLAIFEEPAAGGGPVEFAKQSVAFLRAIEAEL